jgi:hypothetical protein
MKLKYILIASLVLNIAILALLFMQKGAYVSQAEEAYLKKTEAYYKQAVNIVEGQNSVIENNAILWNIACTANQTAKTSKDFATIEKRLGTPTFTAKLSGTPDGNGTLRTLSWNSDYYIVASFDRQKALQSIDVSALLGKAEPLMPETEEDEETESEE